MAEKTSYMRGIDRIFQKSETAIARMGDSMWDTMDSPLVGGKYSFDEHFRSVLPEEAPNLKEYIETTLSPKSGKATMLELGGTGSHLAAGFTPGFLARSASISRTDYRDLIDPRLKAEDARRNHSVITGDLLLEETRVKAQTYGSAEGKFDILLTRMDGGDDFLPAEPFYMAKQANSWYKMIAEDGILFAQLPEAFRESASLWERFVQQQYSSVLDVQVNKDSIYTNMRLRKLVSAPEALPLLPAKEVMKLAKVSYPTNH